MGSLNEEVVTAAGEDGTEIDPNASYDLPTATAPPRARCQRRGQRQQRSLVRRRRGLTARHTRQSLVRGNPMESKDLAIALARALDAKKARNIRILRVQ